MSNKHFTANVISATKIVPNGSFIGSSASGVWTLDEHYDLIKGDNWPRQENGPSPRGFQFGGFDGNNNFDRIDVYDLTTTGNSTDFGNMTESIRFGTVTGSSSRIVRFGGTSSSNANRNNIKYITAATSGDEQNFGDLSAQHEQGGALSNDTRALAGGGNWGGSNNGTIEYVTIASTGNGTDFGNLSANRTSITGCASTTRGIFAGGTNVIDYVTIGSTGDASDFGDLDASKYSLASVASSTRGVFSGGNTDAISIEYITIANTGNTTDFGDLDSARNHPFGSCSKTIGVFSGGLLSGSALSTAQQITIASTGNSTSFGTLTAARYYGDGASNAHGGI